MFWESRGRVFSAGGKEKELFEELEELEGLAARVYHYSRVVIAYPHPALPALTLTHVSSSVGIVGKGKAPRLEP
jgi:hypothetical protein